MVGYHFANVLRKRPKPLFFLMRVVPRLSLLKGFNIKHVVDTPLGIFHVPHNLLSDITHYWSYSLLDILVMPMSINS